MYTFIWETILRVAVPEHCLPSMVGLATIATLYSIMKTIKKKTSLLSTVNQLVIDFTNDTGVLPNKATLVELIYWAQAKEDIREEGKKVAFEGIKNYHDPKIKEEQPTAATYPPNNQSTEASRTSTTSTTRIDDRSTVVGKTNTAS